MSAGGPGQLVSAALVLGRAADETNAPSIEQEPATAFFSSVGERLGEAARPAGVQRTVVLSIIGVDRTPEDGYFVAKLAHERATQAHAPGARVLRAAQFHEFPGQILGWVRDGDRAEIPDQPIQPVDLDEVVRVLLDLATADDAPAVTELAGLRPEQLPDLVARLDPSVTVTPVPASDAVAGGALRPGEGRPSPGALPARGAGLAARRRGDARVHAREPGRSHRGVEGRTARDHRATRAR